MKCRIYVEGGGDRDDLRTEGSRQFTKLIQNAGFKRPYMPEFRFFGGRAATFKAFCIAHKQRRKDEIVLLLVDSESAIRFGDSKWKHLRDRPGDGWEPPAGAGEDDVFFMVQVMETWLVADPQALATYFGQGFNAKALPNRSNLEEEAKEDVYSKLALATRGTKSKGEYRKGAHSFKLIGLIDPSRLEQLPHAKDFLNFLRDKLGVT